MSSGQKKMERASQNRVEFPLSNVRMIEPPRDMVKPSKNRKLEWGI